MQSTTYSLGHIAGVCLLGMLRFIQAVDNKDGERGLGRKEALSEQSLA